MDDFQTAKVERLRRRFKGVERQSEGSILYTTVGVGLCSLDWTRAGALSELIILSSVIEPDHASFCVCFAMPYGSRSIMNFEFI